MPADRSFRFLHAAGVGPGRRLRCLPSLSDDDRATAASASIDVWDAVVETATVEEAKFLLVTDSPVDEWVTSPPGRDALRTGLSRLEAAGIAVVWVLDRGDRVLEGDDASRIRFVGRSSDVVDLPADTGGAGVRIEVGDASEGRDGRVVIRCDRRDRRRDDLLDVEPPAGVAYVGLKAVPGLGVTGRQTDGVCVRHVGPCLPIEEHDRGAAGATLVEVDRKGRADARHLALSPVRRERFLLRADPQDTPDDLAVKAFEAVSSIAASPCERLWLVRWVVVTSDRSASLHTDEIRRRFHNDLAAIDPPSAAVAVTHDLSVVGGDASLETVPHVDAAMLRREIGTAVTSRRVARMPAGDSAAGDVAAAVASADDAFVTAAASSRVAAALAAVAK
ncbi:MAG: hypothetical protein AAF532_15075 [Planctomycetota bacterium]